jgi:hypothetical protein
VSVECGAIGVILPSQNHICQQWQPRIFAKKPLLEEGRGWMKQGAYATVHIQQMESAWLRIFEKQQ